MTCFSAFGAFFSPSPEFLFRRNWTAAMIGLRQKLRPDMEGKANRAIALRRRIRLRRNCALIPRPPGGLRGAPLDSAKIHLPLSSR